MIHCRRVYGYTVIHLYIYMGKLIKFPKPDFFGDFLLGEISGHLTNPPPGGKLTPLSSYLHALKDFQEKSSINNKTKSCLLFTRKSRWWFLLFPNSTCSQQKTFMIHRSLPPITKCVSIAGSYCGKPLASFATW